MMVMVYMGTGGVTTGVAEQRCMESNGGSVG